MLQKMQTATRDHEIERVFVELHPASIGLNKTQIWMIFLGVAELGLNYALIAIVDRHNLACRNQSGHLGSSITPATTNLQNSGCGQKSFKTVFKIHWIDFS